MTVIANDFVPLVPYETDFVTLGIGQRTDVLVKATRDPAQTFWMRSNISSICSLPTQPYGLAAIYYSDAEDDAIPDSLATPYTENSCGNVSAGCYSFVEHAIDSR